jgi:uncharacterized membrane protein YedE/YeeE
MTDKNLMREGESTMDSLVGLWEQILEYPVGSRVAVAGAVIGTVLGFVMQRTNFCTMGALSDINAFGDWRRFRSWVLAMAVAIMATQTLAYFDYVDMSRAIYTTKNFAWLAFAVGGFIFGIGMVFGSGCGAKSLLRLGGGDLKGLVVVLIIGLVGYMTLRGILAPARIALNGWGTLDMETLGLANTGFDTILAAATSLEAKTAIAVAAVIAALALLIYCFSSASFRKSPNHIFAGVVVGLAVAAAWWATGTLGFDDFEPAPLFSLNFVSPTGNTLQYLMTFTGASISFSIATVFGMVLGAFLGSLSNKSFAIGGFADRNDLIRHLLGGTLMGFGAVTSLGCTVGQGIGGISTLALGSIVALVAIIAGGFVGFKMMERGVLL